MTEPLVRRKKNKDHLDTSPIHLATKSVLAPEGLNSGLVWWTSHPHDHCLVDLRFLATGEQERKSKLGTRVGFWGGPFTGRPHLIAELEATLRRRTQKASSATVEHFLSALRIWWRLFDEIESASKHAGIVVRRTESVLDLDDAHYLAAHRIGIARNNFGRFRSLANDARIELGAEPLEWVLPTAQEPERTLIDEDTEWRLKHHIKRDWISTKNEWARKHTLLKEHARRQSGDGKNELDEEGEIALRNIAEFNRIIAKTGKALPTAKDIADGRSPGTLGYQRIYKSLMRSTHFPTTADADIAFHLVLFSSGWNPSTVLSIDALNPNVIAKTPKSDASLALRGITFDSAIGANTENEVLEIQAEKARAGGKIQVCTGLAKNTCSPPSVVKAYLERSESLRAIAQGQLREALDAYEQNKSKEKSNALFEKIQELRKVVHSVWIYVDQKGNLSRLDGRNWNRYPPVGGQKREISYLEKVLAALFPDPDVNTPALTRSDFRDLYARRAFKSSGGSIVAVMLALGHSSLESTQRYLENNFFRAANERSARELVEQLFNELVNGRLDLTILSHRCRTGEVTREMEERLSEYRTLMRSRLNVACTSPRDPPRHISPNHVSGRLCGAQRCALSCGNARFLPESHDGLCMRAEELFYISNNYPREFWLRGAFEDELLRTEALLEELFDRQTTKKLRETWRQKIETGTHKFPGFLMRDSEAADAISR